MWMEQITEVMRRSQEMLVRATDDTLGLELRSVDVLDFMQDTHVACERIVEAIRSRPEGTSAQLERALVVILGTQATMASILADHYREAVDAWQRNIASGTHHV